MTYNHSVSVAAVITNKDNQILLIKRSDNHEWQIPGGILESFERIEDGLRREVYEESGVQIHIDFLSGAYKHVERGILALVFKCEYRKGDIRTSTESCQVGWFEAHEAKKLMKSNFYIRVSDALSETRKTQYRDHDGYLILK